VQSREPTQGCEIKLQKKYEKVSNAKGQKRLKTGEWIDRQHGNKPSANSSLKTTASIQALSSINALELRSRDESNT
jgi:hypothetical protein